MSTIHKTMLPLRAVKSLWARRFGTITSVACATPAVCLTFDDGPHPEFTPLFVDLMNRFGAKGTFFCLGRYAAEHRDVIRYAAESGHCIGNHTYDHTSFRMIGSRARQQQIDRCAAELKPHMQQYFRPPYGHQGFAAHVDAIRKGYEVVGWNLSAGDWQDRSAEWMAARLLCGLRPGCIVLLHDRMFDAPRPEYFDRQPLLDALRIVLEKSSDRFRFVTVPELLNLGEPERANWYYSADRRWLAALREENGLRREYWESGAGWSDISEGAACSS